MYFRLVKKEFLDVLSVVSRAVSVNSPLPSLHGIKINVKLDSLELTASDMDISIQAIIESNEENKLEVFEPGQIILESRYLLDMVRKLDDEFIEIETIDGNLTKISSGGVNFEINGTSVENYPLIDFEKPENHLVFDSSLLKEIVLQTCFAASDKETKPVLTGVNFRCEGNKLTCVATDSYRLAQKIVYLDEVNEFNITIPAKSLNEVAKIINSDGEVNIYISNKKALFEFGNVLIQTRLIDGQYPETSKLIPSDFKHELKIDVRNMLNAIDRASVVKSEGVSIIKMKMSTGEVEISSRTTEIGSKEIIYPIEYIGDDLTISFKGNYVFDAIKAINCFEIKMQFGGEMKAFIISENKEDTDVLQLVLPIRTFN